LPLLFFVAPLSLTLPAAGEDDRLTAIFARRIMRFLLDGVPPGVRGIHFDSRANIIVTNAKLQASRWIHQQCSTNRSRKLTCVEKICSTANLRASGWSRRKRIGALTNHPKKVVAPEGYGIRVADQVPLGSD
jgi:hypothetical protein